MKTNMILKTLGLAAVMAVSTGALAHGGKDDGPQYGFPGFNNGPAFKESLELIKNVNDRQDRQLERILNGFYDKRIDPVEFRKLMDEQTDIRRMERGFMADGVLNRYEFQKLDNALDAASKHIFKEKHDAQGRPSHGYYGGWNNPYGGNSPYGDYNPYGGHNPWNR